MSQTVYNLEPAAGLHGQEYDAGFNDHLSAVATEDIPMGAIVCRVSGDPGKCKLPAAAADVTGPGSVLGVAVYDSMIPQAEGASVPTYKSGSRVQILHVGRIRIKFEDNVANGAPLFVRFQGAGTKGALRSDADTANAAALTGANAALGIVEISRRGV